MSLHQIVLTQKDHCSQNAVLGSQLPCPYSKSVLISSVLTTRDEEGTIRLSKTQSKAADEPHLNALNAFAINNPAKSAACLTSAGEGMSAVVALPA